MITVSLTILILYHRTLYLDMVFLRADKSVAFLTIGWIVIYFDLKIKFATIA